MTERRLGILLCAPAATVMLAVAGWPVAYAVWLSFQRFDLKVPTRREFIGLDNYLAVLTSEFWWTACGTTLLVTIVSVAIETALGLAIALVMHRAPVGRAAVRTASLVPYGLVTVVAAFSWRYAWTPDTGYLANLLTPDTAPLAERGGALAVIIATEVWKTTPFMALLLLAGLALVPGDLLKAAAMDGAGPWQRLTKVILPLMKPAILAAVLFRAVDAFRIFDSIVVLTQGAQGTSSVSVVAHHNLVKGLNLGIGSTISVLIFATVAIATLLCGRLFGTVTLTSGRR